jgi:O-antigen ligase
MIGLLLTAILYRKKEFRLNLTRPFWAITGLFFVVLLSGINSDNLGDWFHHLRIKLPFLILPFAFLNLPKIKARNYHLIHYLFAGLMFVAALPPMVNYLIHFNEFQNAIGQGKSLELPVQHIKFSVFYAFGIIALIILYRKKFVLRWPIERKIQLVGIVTSIVVLHLLAVRTGILVFYVAVVGLALIEGFNRGQWKNILLVLVILLSIPVISYYTIPSFHQKVDYMLWDYGKHNLGEGAGYSDSERIVSLEVGMEIASRAPILGTGIGDLKDECEAIYVKKYGVGKKVLYPHNQYLFILAGMGIVGLFFFLFCLVYPYVSLITRMHPLFLALGMVSITVFILDNFLERSVGVGFYVCFLCLGIQFLGNKEEE